MYKIYTTNAFLLHFKIKIPSTFFYTKLFFNFTFTLPLTQHLKRKYS